MKLDYQVPEIAFAISATEIVLLSFAHFNP
jgi:hypothetical protein